MGKCSVKAEIKSTIIKPDGLRLCVAGHDNHLCNCFSLRKNTKKCAKENNKTRML